MKLQQGIHQVIFKAHITDLLAVQYAALQWWIQEQLCHPACGEQEHPRTVTLAATTSPAVCLTVPAKHSENLSGDVFQQPGWTGCKNSHVQKIETKNLP